VADLRNGGPLPLSPAAALTQSTEVDAGSLMFGFGFTPTSGRLGLTTSAVPSSQITVRFKLDSDDDRAKGLCRD